MKFNPSQAMNKIPSEHKGTVVRDTNGLIFMVVQMSFSISKLREAGHNPESYMYLVMLDDTGNTGVVVPVLRSDFQQRMVEVEPQPIDLREV